MAIKNNQKKKQNKKNHAKSTDITRWDCIERIFKKKTFDGEPCINNYPLFFVQKHQLLTGMIEQIS